MRTSNEVVSVSSPLSDEATVSMRHGDDGLYRQLARQRSRNFTFTRVRCVRSDPELAARWLGAKV
jgi:hypothetical protein